MEEATMLELSAHRPYRVPRLRTRSAAQRQTGLFLLANAALLAGAAALGFLGGTQDRPTLSAPFERKVLTPPGEAPLNLRMFVGAVKTDSQGKIITGPTSDPVKN